MKKLILLAALILVAGLCFAQEAEAASEEAGPEFFDLEVTLGVPIHWTNSPNDHDLIGTNSIDKTVTANTAIGLGLLWNFSQKFGLTVDMDVFFGSDVIGISGNDSASNTLFGVNMLVGPVIYLYNGSFLRIPLALGAHVYYWSADHWDPNAMAQGAWVKNRDLQVGPGAYLGIQFHFNDNIYIFSRTNIAITVFRWHQEAGGGVSNSEVDVPILGWHVKPTLGVGVKF